MGKQSGRMFDKIVVIDIEATCWAPGQEPPSGEKSEIIEIGGCTVDLETLEVSDKVSLLCRPQISSVSQYCTELTTLTQERLDREGIPFQDACQILKDQLRTKKRSWGSFGTYDLTQFNENCKDFNIKSPFGGRHIDIKLMATILLGLKKAPGLKKLCAIIDIPMEGTHHRGDDDAWNTAKILAKLIRVRRLVTVENIDVYAENRHLRECLAEIKELARPDRHIHDIASKAIQMDVAEKRRVLNADEKEYERDG